MWLYTYGSSRVIDDPLCTCSFRSTLMICTAYFVLSYQCYQWGIWRPSKRRATALAACDPKPCYNAVQLLAGLFDAFNLGFLLRRSYHP